jgi:hypothetical protein
LLAIYYVEPLSLQSEEHHRLHHVHAQRLVLQTTLLQLDPDLAGYVFGQAGIRWSRPSQGRDAGPGALSQPGAVHLVVPGRRAKVPHDGFVILRQEGEPHQLVQRPGANDGRRQVTDVIHIETQQRSQIRFPKELFDPVQAFVA